MKTIWIAIILFLIILAGSIGLFLYTTALSNQLQESLQIIYGAVEDGDWKAADIETKQLRKIWARTNASWTPIMDHRQVDHLDESLIRVMKLTELQRREELLIELVVAMRTAKKIKETEVPTVRNIF